MRRSCLAFVVSLLCLDVAAAVEPPRLPTEVELGIYVVDITNFNQRENTFVAELDVVTRWQDPRRAFTPEEGQPDYRVFRGGEAIAELNGAWSGELHIANTLGNLSLGVTRTRIDRDGTVTNRIRLRGTLRAQLDFRKFPFDSQQLPIHIESFAWTADKLRIVKEEEFSGFDPAYDMPEWNLEDLKTSQGIVERAQTGEQFDRMTFTVHIQRKTGYYLWKILLPLLVITAISWVVFWMTDDALGRRAGVSSTGMLTVIAYQLILADSLPRFPYLTIMDKVALLTLVLIAATMLENILGSRMEREARARLDRACRIIFPVTYYACLAIALGPLLF